MVKKRHNRDDVVREALAMLEDVGIEAVTLRGVAKRMGLHLNSVSFQVESKARLFELMAEVILGELSLADLSDNALERITEVALRLRLAMLSHRDGGRVISGTHTADRNALHIAEVLITAFQELGVDERVAARASVALHCLIIGLVEEEQVIRPKRRAVPDGVDDYHKLAHISRLLEEDTYGERAVFGIEAIINQAVSTTR
ncbi:TetR/AcrR family transcriptional regulator C-terminal domain-containing protein [Paenibacillus antibioticophila]|uniref:TetR/AcrR family transcriptional regulator C-terminal domain-containing protein n=1 Tax=Paenibacillus antibioticophila TaxID=1274374 RepID=UPI000677F157|nr:TetR/AcrR family transcriptional regulator C-terminal domain-containing protein [Paenibacillus antibioticophila]